MAPARGAGSPAQSVCIGGDGERMQVRGKGTARRAQLPQKSAYGRLGGSGLRPAGGPGRAAPVSPFTLDYCNTTRTTST
eukprot:5737807-Alexandrium_andersonii.AAC.1